MNAPSIKDDPAWRKWRDEWPIRTDTIYLNHGSFGPPPRRVIAAQEEWQQRLRSQPMDFYARQFEPAWLAARDRLARFVDAAPDCIAFVENATDGMNVVANSFPLQANDEVLLTDHEYGAVVRIWQRACDAAGAILRTAALPERFHDEQEIVDALFSAATDRTRLLVVSHITSPSAVILPVRQICEEARRRGIAVVVDGPHAPAQTALSLRSLPCDFYCVSLHKWVSAPFGSGFLWVDPRWHAQIKPTQLCWGRLLPRRPEAWWEEFIWPGTRDSSPYLATTAALDLLENEVGLDAFRARTHALARYARERIVELTGLEPPTAEAWYGSMVSCPLPPGEARPLMERLWQRYRIEVPVVEHLGKRSVRVSCHLYTNRADIDALVAALREELPRSWAE
ncbi:aminotransferase class V-fold PLP-dependent enzyme [Endothiovibrio diazotrophicus]